MTPRVTCVVPARLGSTRFFGKLLTPVFGKPVIVHTLERALGAGCFDRVVCLTDSTEIGAAVSEHGFEWVLTGEAANGTERIARSLESIESDLIVNLQGDEPAFPEDGLRTLCAALRREPDTVHILVHDAMATTEEIANPNRVKVAVDADGFVAGFFRTAPTGADAPDRAVASHGPTIATLRLQLGAYAYHRDYLAAYAALPPSVDEIEMSHEMLRARGLAPMRAHLSRPGASVDVPEDLITARSALTKILDNTSAPEFSASRQQQPRLHGAPA